jgi:uncharacterized protein (TIGR03435 family)
MTQRQIANRSVAALFVAAACAAYAQSAPSLTSDSNKLPQFEVASVRPVDSSKHHMTGIAVEAGGRIRIQALTLKELICAAYHISFWQISGGEPWMSNDQEDQFDITAVPPDSYRSDTLNTGHAWQTIEDEQLRQMLQALLIDRFQLRFHRDSKTGTIYLLEQKGKISALKPSGKTGGYDEVGWAGGWVITNSTMPQIARFASNYILHAAVIDRTGIAGAFNHKGPQEDAATHNFHDETESFETMLQDIGLKLTPSKGPVESFVIDHAGQPSAN